MDLTAKQRETYQKFNKKFGHLVPAGPDHEFQTGKWLVARNFDLEKAETMLRKHLEWRKEWDVDNILSFQPPEVLLKYYPIGEMGFDEEGCAIWIVPLGQADMRGILQSCHKNDYIKNTIRKLEYCFKQTGGITSPNGKRHYKTSVIFDMEGFTLSQYAWKPAVDLVLDLIKIYEANYPEILKAALVINAPKLFAIIHATVKPFLDEKTISKIQIYGKTGWEEFIFKVIPGELLPKHYGGERIDPDGDPKCPSVLVMGGPVPKSCYLKNRRNVDAVTTGFQKVVLAQGSKQAVAYNVSDSGTMLSWDFQTDDFDIGFSIHRNTHENQDETLLPMQRVNCHMIPEQGQLLCTIPGEYVVTFDNEFSYIRSKEILYNIQLDLPSATTKM